MIAVSQYLFRLPQRGFNFFEKKGKKRRAFKISTKKREWNKAAGRDEDDSKSTSKCRHCRRKLVEGTRTYDFDHKDNNSSNISQKNCYLLCRNCHGRMTKIEKRRIIDRLTGIVTGHKTIKRKILDKKPRKKLHKRKKKKYNPYLIQPIRIPRIKF